MNNIKKIVKQKYSSIALQNLKHEQLNCCGNSGCCGNTGFSMIGNEYNGIEGHNPDADLGLGCGIPTQHANIQPGHYVLDLGSGAGNDCFVARAIVGEKGKVTGLDFTEAMVLKARSNNLKMGYNNVEFIKGDIENIPLPDNYFDIIVSNCVLNLVPNKHKAFAQMYRVLKPEGHFCISDVVVKGQLPDKLRKNTEMYVGCVSGAINIDEYLEIINKQDFTNVTIHKQTKISIPNNILERLLLKEEIEHLKHNDTGIYSITISGYK